VVVPPGMIAEFHLPYVTDEPLVTLDNHPFYDGSAFAQDSRVKDAKSAPGRLEMQLSPGSYYFRSYSGSGRGASSKIGRISVGGR